MKNNLFNKLISYGRVQDKLWNMNFILLFQGQFISVFGNILYDTALRIWIIDNTGSTALMATIMAATTIPEVFISPFAGTFIDRHDRKKVLVITDIINGVAILFIGTAALLGFLKTWMLLVVGIIVGVCSCFFNPTIDSAIPDIVPKSKLLKANSVFSSMNAGNDMIGYSIGTIFINFLGAPAAFIFNGVSYLFSAASETLIRIPKVKREETKVTFWEDLKAGIKFIKNSQGLIYLYITISALNLVAAMSMTLTLPWFLANKELGTISYGVAMAINTFGMFIGFAILTIVELRKEKKFYIFIVSEMIVSITMMIYSFSLNIYLVYLLFFVNGICLAIANSLIMASIQNYVPQHMRSKVFAFRRTLSAALIPLGVIIAGILAEYIKMNRIIFLDYLIYFLLILYLLTRSSVRDIINA